MRIQKVIGTLMGLALVLGMATPARAEGTILKAGFNLVHFGEFDFTPVGFNVEFNKEIKPSDKGGLDIIGEFGFVNQDGDKLTTVGGGVQQRFTPEGAKASFFVHGIGGLMHDNSGFDANNLYTAFGGGVDVIANENTGFFGQVDVITWYIGDGFTTTGVRFVAGVRITR